MSDARRPAGCTEVPPIVTPRLELVSLGPLEISALLDGRAGALAGPAGFVIPAGAELGESVLRMRLAQMETNPEHRPWLLRAMVERQTRVLCGRIGFHSPPAPADLAAVAPGGVELGYEVAPEFRRRGYAREAALALMKWAFDVHAQRVFVLSISPGNAPSLAMARSLGFVEQGSHIDDEDGLELYFVRRLGSWPGEWSATPAG